MNDAYELHKLKALLLSLYTVISVSAGLTALFSGETVLGSAVIGLGWPVFMGMVVGRIAVTEILGIK